MVGICWWQNPTMAINDKFPPWWDFVMVGICRKAMIIMMMMNCDDDGALWWWWCTVMIIIAVMMMMHCGDDHAMWWCTVMMIMMIHCDDDDGLWWWWCTVMMHCDDDNARWWYWIYHIYSVSLSISRTFLAQFGLFSCGSQRRKISRFLGHCTNSHKNSCWEPV